MAWSVSTRLCSIEGCERTVDAREWCAVHYGRWRNHGDPLWVKTIPQEKICGKCGVLKDLEEFSFDKRHDDGRQSHCRACARERAARERKEHPSRVKARKAAEYERNKEQIAAYQRRYRELNGEALRKAARHRQKFPTEEQREAHRAASIRYAEANRDVVRQRVRDWHKRHPEAAGQAQARRRAWKWGAEHETFTTEEIAVRDCWVCGICGDPIDPNTVFPNPMYRSIDHIRPLSKGGGHLRNNVRITHMICNVRRQNKWEEEDEFSKAG